MNVTPIYTLKERKKKNTSIAHLPTYTKSLGATGRISKNYKRHDKLGINKNNVGLYFPAILNGYLAISYHTKRGARVI
jgi:hypothetical protein